MGRDKLLLEYNGKSLLQYAVDLLSDLPVDERIIITTDARAEHIILPPGIRLCINYNPEIGQSESIRLAIEQTETQGMTQEIRSPVSSEEHKERKKSDPLCNSYNSSSYLFLNADQPRLTVKDVLQLLAVAKENPNMIIYPMIDDQPCSPTIFPNIFCSQLLNLTGDDGGRVIRNVNKEYCLAVTPTVPENFIDVDNEEDYHDLIDGKRTAC